MKSQTKEFLDRLFTEDNVNKDNIIEEDRQNDKIEKCDISNIYVVKSHYYESGNDDNYRSDEIVGITKAKDSKEAIIEICGSEEPEFHIGALNIEKYYTINLREYLEE